MRWVGGGGGGNPAEVIQNKGFKGLSRCFSSASADVVDYTGCGWLRVRRSRDVEASARGLAFFFGVRDV